MPERVALVSGLSFPNDFHQHALASPPVEFAAEDLLPGAEIRSTFSHGEDHVASHDLPLDVGIGVVFPHVVVPVLAQRLVRCYLLQPAS